MTPINPIVIAIDGPAGSGKGTLARSLARHLGFAYLDTGALYRLIGHHMLKAGEDPANAQKAQETALLLSTRLDVSALDDPALRSDAVGQAASKVAQFAGVRDALLDVQRAFAQNPSHFSGMTDCGGAILDGRDIGTVICPDAAVKLFITASVEERARRRLQDLNERGLKADFDTVLTELKARDERDMTRAAAPLKPAPDAVILDTTALAPADVMTHALAHITARRTKII